MKNKLEHFVNLHRDEFDSDMPAKDLWEGIEKTPALSKSKIIFSFSRLQVAAAILIIINAAVLVLLLEKKPTVITTPVTPVEQPGVSRQPQEETLDLISKSVELKQAKLKEISRSNPVLYKKFMNALNELNATYKELEKELDQNPNKEQLLEAMIQNLSLQQELLNQQLSIYQKIKSNKNEKII